MQDEGVQKAPSQQIQKKAKKAGFDWPDIGGAVDKLKEELSELSEAIDGKNPEAIAEELGDLLFAAVNTARFLDLDPEQALHRSCDKFIRRFSYIEDKAERKGLSLGKMSLEEMEELYQEGKASEIPLK